MSKYNQIFQLLFLCSVLCVSACKSDSRSGDPSLDAFGPDTLTHDAPSKEMSSGSRTQPTSPQKSIPGRNSSKPASGREETSKTGEGNQAESTSGAMTRPEGPSGHKWWDNRTVFFVDWVGGTGDIVYEAVKGQKYFQETRIFIYATDKAMEGTMNYSKTELTMKETELDDRIFIWVNLDDKRKPLFVKTLISDNIKNKINSAPLKL